MIKVFWKNTYKKNNIRQYLSFFTVTFFVIILLVVFNNYINEYNFQKLNNDDNLVLDIFANNINFGDIKEYVKTIKNCEKQECVSDADNVIEIIAKSYDDKINLINYLENEAIEYENIVAYNEDNYSNYIKIIIHILIIILAILFVIVIIFFNKDDEYNNKLLMSFGYSKIKIFFINYMIMASMIISLVIFSTLVIGTLSLLINNLALNYFNLLKEISILSITLLFITFVIYYIYFQLNYKKSVIKL